MTAFQWRVIKQPEEVRMGIIYWIVGVGTLIIIGEFSLVSGMEGENRAALRSAVLSLALWWRGMPDWGRSAVLAC